MFLEKNTGMDVKSYTLAGKRESAWDEAKGEKERT